MFGTIRKHQKWLWAVIITLTIISFVIFFSPTSKLNDGRRSNYGTINGEKVTESDFMNARREIELHYFFMTGRWPEEDKRNFDPLRETYQWLLLAQKEREFGIELADDVAQQLARQLLRPFERMGITSPTLFMDKVLRPRGFTEADLERFVRHYGGIQELIAALGLSGKLVTPLEIRALYDRENQQLSTALVRFSYSNHLASILVSPESVAQFYTNRLANYRIPDRIQVNYVRFNVTNFLAGSESELSTNLNEMIEANYRRVGTNTFADAKTPDEIKAKIRTELIRAQAMAAARKKAIAFATTLFDLKSPTADSLAALAKTNGLEVAVSEPFGRDDEPKGLSVGPDFAKFAFRLSADEPFGGPLQGSDGQYVFSLNKKIPSEVPPLAQIRDQVTEDYRRVQALSMARQASAAFFQTLTNGLAQGKAFAAVCAEAKVIPVDLPPFSLSTQALPEADDLAPLDQLKQAAFGTTPGKPSQILPTADGSLILFVKAKLAIDEAKARTDLPEFTNLVRRRRQEEAFNLWLSREAEKGLRDTPLARQQQAPPASVSNDKAKS